MPKYFIFLIVSFFLFQSNIHAKMYAVVVGVAEYANPKNKLTYADNDAKIFYEYAISASGLNISSANISVLINSQATHAEIIAAMNKQFSKAVSGDKIIFYFSGHGGEGLFVPYDAETGGYLLHSEVKSAFKNSKAGTKICFADACHSGSLKSPNAKEYIFNGKSEKAYSSGIVVMMSSRASETSAERPIMGQGVFTYYLLKGLKGNADIDKNNIITITELFAYTHKNVVAFSKEAQHPTLAGNFDKNMTIK